MKLSITGSREFIDYNKFVSELEKFLKISNFTVHTIISGGAKGVDSLAAWYAKQNHIELIEILPKWEKFGKSAGLIRNKLIIDQADFNLMFWDGKSKGTKSNIDYCHKNFLKYIVIPIENTKTDLKKIQRILTCLER